MRPPTSPAPRLFFALWPDEPLRRRLVSCSERLLGRRVPAEMPADLHLTLLFLGKVPAALQPELLAAAASLRVQTFELVLDRSGYWPRPRVCWLAPSRPPGGLMQLAFALREQAATLGLRVSQGVYRPHLTLARRVPPQVNRVLAPPLPWQVRDFVLVASALQARPRYRVVQRWPLLAG